MVNDAHEGAGASPAPVERSSTVLSWVARAIVAGKSGHDYGPSDMTTYFRQDISRLHRGPAFDRRLAATRGRLSSCARPGGWGTRPYVSIAE